MTAVSSIRGSRCSTAASSTPFARLAETLDQAAKTRGRNDRIKLLADFLGGLSPDEVKPAVNLMLGRGPGFKTGLSWAGLFAAARQVYGDEMDWSGDGYVDAGEAVRRMAAASASQATGLAVMDVVQGLGALAQLRGRIAKERALADLLRRATPDEAAWIGRNATGEMRTGAQEGVILEAIALAAGQPADAIRRALIGASDVASVAEAALTDSGARLADLGIRVFAPIPPMLADSAADVAEAYASLKGKLALEWKLDGARVQIHKRGTEVELWSRRMTNVTARLPDIAAMARDGLAVNEAIVEGEVLVLRGGQAVPFQDTMRRWLRSSGTESAATETPASLFLFDCLYADGEAILDEPYSDRWLALERVRGDVPVMPRLVPADPTEGQRFYEESVAAGHEGLMAKALDAPYAPGKRGSNWLKIKAENTYDFVVIGADWGTGRRHRWLSNYRLACREEATGELLSVGETFKGLTDVQFEEMTARLLALKVSQRGGYVAVKPEVVVEVKFNGVQRSTRLPSGIALRFARITRIRDDKPAGEVDTLQTLQKLLPSGEEEEG